MIGLSAHVHDAVAAVAPVVSVSIGDAADRLAWRVIFREDATDAQKQAAARVVATFDVTQVERKALLAAVDDGAAHAMARIRTPSRDLIYAEKFAQAQAVESMGKDAANSLKESDAVAQFPLLAASVGIESPTLYAAAELILMKYAQFAQASMVIERIRLGAKKAIADAKTVEAATAVLADISWPT